jgi:hypothetical protein
VTLTPWFSILICQAGQLLAGSGFIDPQARTFAGRDQSYAIVTGTKSL